ncbi:MAG: Holliday junction branch migration protein RuvA [Spirochaetes bacterium]|nr:Holliday junction branch migration protein RuvA [Spirochaetota bacterium]MBU1079590.1 Holliday junction branch migration protein RuvA [Spirochaetota bacterium]
MFNAVRGTLCYKGADSIRIDTYGVEWEFAVPARSVDSFGRLGDEARVLCWLLHRDDQMRLFGFASESERSVFVELMGVDGIGPKQALKILGGIGADELESALEAEDLARLESIPGLGKKTAQKLVFTLKGKLPSRLASRGLAATGPHEDIMRALVDMGYDRRRVSETLARLDADMPASTPERERELLRSAIVELSAS